MAGLQVRKRKNGCAYIVQFILCGERGSVFLSKDYSRESAEDIVRIVNKLVSSIETGIRPDDQTMVWLNHMSPDLRQRLENAGLVKRRFNPTIKELFDLYFEKNKNVFSSKTKELKIDVFKMIFKFVNPKLQISDLTENVLNKSFEEMQKVYSKASLQFASVNIKTMFNWAVKTGLIKTSPCKNLKSFSSKNKNREYFIDMELYNKFLNCCKHQYQRAILALYRIGGLRREEALLLKWDDVDFKNKTLTVTSPKTERSGKESRVIPLFPELEKELISLDRDSKFVIHQFANGKCVYVWFRNLLKNNGFDTYPRAIQNFRSSRANEIFREFGELAESEWLGHKTQTALEHYLHSTNEEFKRAICGCKSG